MRLSAHQQSLTALISSSARGFSVPDFQRNYSWSDSQVTQFWVDVLSIYENRGSDHFMGPIVLLDSENERKPLIDGQQRLTTIVILASVIRDYLIEVLGNPDLEIAGNRVVISQKLSPLLFLSDLQTTRLASNYQIRAIFESYIVKNPNTSERRKFNSSPSLLTHSDKRNAKSLISSQTTLLAEFARWIESLPAERSIRINAIDELIGVLLEKLQFLSIHVGDEEDAFTIFETLNDRGLKLSPGDLIKSYLLRKVIDQNPTITRSTIIEKWEGILENLEDYDVSNFLRHYLLTQEAVPVQKSGIFSQIKKQVEDSGHRDPNSARKKLDDISVSTLYYGQLLGNSNSSVDNAEVERRLGLISMIGDSYRIFLLKVMQLGFIDSDLLLAVKSAEKLALRWAISGQNAQVLESLFQRFGHDLTQGDSEGLKAVCTSLISASPDDVIFHSSIMNKTSKDTKLQAYIMRSLCFGLTGSDVTTDRQAVSVEHIAPQSPSGDYWYGKIAVRDSDNEERTYEDYIYMWGNITILEKKLNSSVRDSSWEVKLAGNGRFNGYNATGISVTQQLLQVPDWNRDTIERRTTWVADQAVRYWSRDLPDREIVRLTPFNI